MSLTSRDKSDLEAAEAWGNPNRISDADEASIEAFLAGLAHARKEQEQLVEALEKIADPRKRDHKEPDAYTTLGCVMHIAEEALAHYRVASAKPTGGV